MPTIDDILPLPKDPADLPLPTPFYHVIGSDGLHMMKTGLYGRALIPVKTIDHLPKTGALLWKEIPKVPGALISQAWSFFKTTFATKGSEAMVYLTYKDGQYRIFVPRQEASVVHVNAELNPSHISLGWRIAGTIHSHCDFGAFHSGTDTGDASDHDGLHITIGDVNKDAPSIAGMIAVNGLNWDLEFEEYSDAPLEVVAHPAHWARYIVGEIKPAPAKIGQLVEFTGGWNRFEGWEKTTAAYHAWRDDDDYLGGDQAFKTKYPAPTRSVLGAAAKAIAEGDILGFESDMALRTWAALIDEDIADLEDALHKTGLGSYFSVYYSQPIPKSLRTESTTDVRVINP